MRVTLVHNPDAGSGIEEDSLAALLACQGHEVSCRSSKSASLDEALGEPADLVVVAGGDGTVAKVLRRLPDRRVPVGILPCGTANNIATALGVRGEPSDVIAGWAEGVVRGFEMASATGPWGTRRLVEGLGLGALAEATGVATRETGDSGDKVGGGRDALRRVLERARPLRGPVLVDGEVLGDDLLLVEVMLIDRVGPALPLARLADPGDGMFDIVTVRADCRDALLDWLADDPDRSPAPVERRRGRRVALTWHGAALRLDDEVPPTPREPAGVTLGMEEEPVRLLVPCPAPTDSDRRMP